MSGASSLTEEKEILRNQYRKRRLDQDPSEGARASARVVERVRSLLAPYREVAGYMAYRGEVDLDALYEELIDAEVALHLPRVAGPGKMDFVRVDDLSALRPGAYGILEPQGPAQPLATIEAFLVPGVAFDAHGVRIGFGGGYYDRALSARLEQAARPDEVAEAQTPFFIGVAFDWQVHDEALPAAEHDVRMHCIVTDEAVVTCTS